jgi:hypothetical protein
MLKYREYVQERQIVNSHFCNVLKNVCPVQSVSVCQHWTDSLIDFLGPPLVMGFCVLHHVVWYKFTDGSEVLAASIIIAQMMVAGTSEMSVNLYLTTWHIIPEDSHLHVCQH